MSKESKKIERVAMSAFQYKNLFIRNNEEKTVRSQEDRIASIHNIPS